ncbi:MAG: hypothetical protein ACYC5O_12330 [Anaerolineae bacterium]
MSSSRVSNPSALLLGLVLIGIGGLFLLGPLLGISLLAFSWPLLILLPGVLLLVGAVAGGKSAAPLAVPGCLLTTLGGILLLQNSFDYFESWAYAWALLPAAVGVGIALIGLRHADRTPVAVGAGIAAVSLVVFALAGFAYEVAPLLAGYFERTGNVRLWRNLIDLIWPFYIIVPGLLLFVAMFVGGRSAGPLAIPASVITTVGGVLLLQVMLDYFAAWAYAWALIPVAVGFGLVVNGLWSRKPESTRAGTHLMVVGGTLFVVFGTVFELVFNISGFANPGLSQVIWPVLLIVVGLAVLLRNVFGSPARVR